VVSLCQNNWFPPRSTNDLQRVDNCDAASPSHSHARRTQKTAGNSKTPPQQSEKDKQKYFKAQLFYFIALLFLLLIFLLGELVNAINH
jgi:hypothetical protein